MRQDIRSGSLDILTAGEFSDQLHKHMLEQETREQRRLREQFAGMRAIKLPRINVNATANSFTLAEPGGNVPCGPESGFIWLVRRILVSSNLVTDQAAWQLYSGSDTSAQPWQAVDFIGSHGDNNIIAPTIIPVVLGTTGQNLINQNQYPVNVTISGGTGVVIGGNSNVSSGTFYIGPGGTLAVTYTSAPTVSTAWLYTQGTGGTNSPFQSPNGLNVNEAYFPGNKALWVWQGEQIYATVEGATIGQTYSLTGVALEVPHEMQGKIIS